MADIDVFPKRGPSPWVWVIAAVVLVLIVMIMMRVFSHSGNRVGELRHPESARGPALDYIPAA
jgi:hypothetical protein